MKLVIRLLIILSLLQTGAAIAFTGLPSGEEAHHHSIMRSSNHSFEGPRPHHAGHPGEGAHSTGCDTRYPENFFNVCYYSGTNPEADAFLGSDSEPNLGVPVQDRAFGINHDWGMNSVFAGITPGAGGTENDISGVWRARLFFKEGRYQFTAFASDGVRLFIDEHPIIDQWKLQDERFGAVVDLARGFHDIRVEWFSTGLTWWSTFLRLHWDLVPTVSHPKVSPVVVDVFLLKRQETCIAGDPYQSGEPVNVYNPDGTVFRSWQWDARALAPSDPALSTYSQVECFSFGFRPEEIPGAKDTVREFAATVEQWSAGAIKPIIRLHEIEGEVNLARWGGGWWVAPWEIASLAQPFMTTASDFPIVLSSIHDLETGHYVDIGGCGGTFGVELPYLTFGGTGYSWVPHTVNPGFWFQCLESKTLVHEWEHQLTSAIRYLLGYSSLYPDYANYPASGYPPCGEGDPDIFRWFPDSHDWGTDPDSPWCGPTDVVGISELHLFAHFDASLASYPLGFLTGNHCDNGVQDFGETGVDTGGNCPESAIHEGCEPKPIDDAWVHCGHHGHHGAGKPSPDSKGHKR